MLQQSPQPSWLEHNFWQLFQFIVTACLAVGAFATLREKQKTNTENIARLDTRVEGIEKDVEAHCADRQIHIDTVRDERRLSSIERKLDEVHGMLNKMVTARRGGEGAP
jgi:hypothetical protein